MELALAADRVYMLHNEENPESTFVTLSEMSFGPLYTANESSRLANRFYGDEVVVAALRESARKKINAEDAREKGLVTATPDDLDWDDELRLAIESRVALSPDALTGMEANLRFALPESMQTRIFGRLSAWQNWIFIRPNAVGTAGALKVYGSGQKAKFNWERV